ncbi:hypothetical protein [Alteribacter natronophilus]|uniref:hypothetical protein n=1 Tax=Alteribacter natronophilus TaxID=2583810 RepID=UPI00110F004A|nr:hypothetical protein [Alteribacter natronophilus]TMW71466.1 hypothetical protein FGB90_10495 [Alteribacter natronophilus]
MADRDNENSPFGFFDQIMFGSPPAAAKREQEKETGPRGNWLFGGWGNPHEEEPSDHNPEQEEETEEDPLADLDEPTPEELEQMERTMEQITAVIAFAQSVKPYIRHLTPVWDALKSYGSSPDPGEKKNSR